MGEAGDVEAVVARHELEEWLAGGAELRWGDGEAHRACAHHQSGPTVLKGKAKKNIELVGFSCSILFPPITRLERA